MVVGTPCDELVLCISWLISPHSGFSPSCQIFFSAAVWGQPSLPFQSSFYTIQPIGLDPDLVFSIHEHKDFHSWSVTFSPGRKIIVGGSNLCYEKGELQTVLVPMEVLVWIQATDSKAAK